MDLAHGEIGITLKDQATPELRRVEAEYKAAMARIDRMEATAEIKAKTEDLDRQIKEARDKVRMLEGERAVVTVKADKKQLDAELKSARAAVKQLDGKRARIEIEARGVETTLAQIERVKRAEAARAAAEERYSKSRESHSTKAQMDAAREREEVAKLQQEWAKMSDQMERLRTRRTPFGKEARLKVDLETEHLDAKMELTKARLRALGSHPPVGIEVDVDGSALKRMRYKIGRALANAGDKVANVGDIRVMGNSLGTITKVVATLAPMITSLGGGLTALVGVLGTGLTGAAAVGGGALAGLGMNLLGVKAALGPVATDFKINTQLVDAYHKAVLKYGKGSDKASKAQAEMNHALKTMNPLARQAAKSAGGVHTAWQKLTQATAQRDFSKLMIGGVKTLNTLMPTLAHNTNQSMNIITKWGTGVEKALRTPAAVHIFDSLGHSANQFLGPALNGLTHLGAAFGHVAEAAARIFAGQAGHGFEKWAADIDKATQPGDKLDANIRRIGNHAKDLFHFFGALGRILKTVLNGGADSGDRLITTMTNALNRWNKFLNTKQGQDSMQSFFRRSEANVRALWSALGPLIGAFVQWSNLLAPFATGLLKGIGFVSKLVGGFIKLTGLAGPLGALGATIGAMFAVSKIGAFVGMLSRVVGLLKEARAAGGVMAGLKTFGGGIGGAIRPGKAGALDGGAAAAEIRAAHEQGGAAVATQIRAAMAEAGTVVANEERAGETEGGAAAAAAMRAGVTEGGVAAAAEMRAGAAAGGAAGGAAGALEGAAGGLGGMGRMAGAAERTGGLFARAAGGIGRFGTMLTGLPGPIAGVGIAVAALYGGMKLLDAITESGTEKFDKFAKQQDAVQKAAAQGVAANNQRYMQARDTLGDYGSTMQHANESVKDARKALDGTTKGTEAYRRALLNLHDAQRQATQSRAAFFQDRDAMERAAGNQSRNANVAVASNQKLIDGYKQRMAVMAAAGQKDSIAYKVLQAELEATQTKTAGLRETQEAAWNRVAALPMQAARGIRGFAALTGEAEQAVGRLARTAGGKNIATKLSIKYDDPKKAGKVASQAREALNAGVGKGTVMRIVADSRSADAAIRRLQVARLTPKTLVLLTRGGPQAVALLQSIIGRKLTPKEQRIVQAGGPEVYALLNRINNNQFKTKTQRIVQAGGEAVSRVLSQLRSYDIGRAVKNITSSGGGSVMDELHSIMSMGDLGTAIKWVSVRKKGALGGLFGLASGGRSDDPLSPSPLLAAKQRRAARIADSASTAQRDGRFNRPRLLVGEEDRTEYVIATNPAYRQRNRRLLHQVARDLDMQVYDPRDPSDTGVQMAATGDVTSAKRKRHKGGGVHVPHARGAPKVSWDTTHILPSHFIGPVDTTDIDHDVQNIGNTVSGIRQQISSLKSALHSTPHDKKHRKTRHHIAQRISALRKLLHHRGKGNDLLDRQRYLKGLSHRAHLAHARFQNLDTDIDTLQTQMETADSQGKSVLFGSLKTQRDRLLHKRLAELRTALKDVGVNSRRTWAVQLRNEIARTLNDIQSNSKMQTAKDAEADSADTQDAAKYGIRVGSKNWRGLVNFYRTQEAINERDVAVAAITPDNAATPDVDENMRARTAAATRTVSFWRDVYNRTARLGNPTAVKDAAEALLTAQGNLNELTGASTTTSSTSTGGQQSIYSTARADLLQSFGSNAVPIWSQPPPDSTSSPSFFGGAGQQNAVPSQAGPPQVSVVNNFPTPPPDPHSWSNGLSWELQAAL